MIDILFFELIGYSKGLRFCRCTANYLGGDVNTVSVFIKPNITKPTKKLLLPHLRDVPTNN
jgi:hypothetical protein